MKKYLIVDSLENIGQIMMSDPGLYDNEEMVNIDLESHVEQLEELYSQIEDEIDPQLVYALGDAINLLSNLKFKDINHELNELADYFINEASNNSSNGSWIIYQEEIEEHLNHEVDEEFMNMLANKIEGNDAVAEVFEVSKDSELNQYFIDIQLWDDPETDIKDEENEL